MFQEITRRKDEAVTFSWSIANVGTATRPVKGIASQEVVDAHGQIVEYADLEVLSFADDRRRERHDLGLPCAVGSGRRAVARSGWSFRAP